MNLEKVVSGGQTGVDRAALDAALDHGIPVGGWCPQGRRAEDGRIPDRYPLRETPSNAYAQRTAWNVRDSDGTLIIAPLPLTGGTALTKAKAEEQQKPVLHIDPGASSPVSLIEVWRVDEGVRVLNVAGPRACEVNGIYAAAYRVLDDLFGAAPL